MRGCVECLLQSRAVHVDVFLDTSSLVTELPIRNPQHVVPQFVLLNVFRLLLSIIILVMINIINDNNNDGNDDDDNSQSIERITPTQ